jgi:hypothetical protein
MFTREQKWNMVLAALYFFVTCSLFVTGIAGLLIGNIPMFSVFPLVPIVSSLTWIPLGRS